MAHGSIRAIVACVALFSVADGITSAGAQPASELTNPPVVGRPVANPSDPMQPMARDISVALSIAYRGGQLWNPSTQRFDRVHLRSYVAEGAATGKLLGPTIVARPGDTLRVHLSNNLPEEDPSCQEHPENINIPHCFNSTNLHTHGLWVSPAGNSDNVFLSFSPGTSFQHEYSIPSDHPAGTFWYHPHLHGSTALQVTSGMSGALILRGDRMPTPQESGDLDVLLRPTSAQPFRERVLLFQQIAYACRDTVGRIKTMPADDEHGIWVCDDDDIGRTRPCSPDTPAKNRQRNAICAE
jgi:FtsP/CotA-like multicopper oxidase with cupredoxin domain